MFGLIPWTKRTVTPLPRAEFPFGYMLEGFPALFNRIFNEFPVFEMPEWPYPWAMTTEETEKEYLVRIELPGVEPEEVKVELLGERLIVEAEHREPAAKKEEKPEGKYLHVKRELTLPTGVALEKAEAIYRKGVLEIHLPRKPEAVGRRIEVKV